RSAASSCCATRSRTWRSTPSSRSPGSRSVAGSWSSSAQRPKTSTASSNTRAASKAPSSPSCSVRRPTARPRSRSDPRARSMSMPSHARSVAAGTSRPRAHSLPSRSSRPGRAYSTPRAPRSPTQDSPFARRSRPLRFPRPCQQVTMQHGYNPPDFDEARLRDAPDARFEPAPADGVLPDDFFATSNLPTYVKVDGQWRLPRAPRMDGAIVKDPDGLRVTEGRYVRKGQPVAIGYAEDGSEGIFVHTTGFLGSAKGGGEFQFMSSEVSREKPVDYARMAELLRQEKERGGHIVWVVGPAVLHSRGRDVVTWFIENGYVGALL